ncbi:MAG: pseudouridine synthase [Planctomycetes bacterium]|nr:pseudouridine synthase [Planctomycetota bacterium]
MDETRRGERLHKLLARAGVASRRESEQLILQGRVKVDGQVVTKLGVIVDPAEHAISFDGRPVYAEPPAHFLVYKPKGVVCTTDDPYGRKSVISLVKDRRALRLFPVGRLEEDSEGLILVTNDGRFAHDVISYQNPLRHVYFVRVRGNLTQEALEQARTGVWLADGKSGPMYIKVQKWGKKVSSIICCPSATQHRLLRRVWSKVGLHADKVVRIRIGPLTTDGLKKGHARRLKPAEIEAVLNPAAEDLGTRRQRSGGKVSGKKRRPPKKAPSRARQRRRKEAQDVEQGMQRRRVIGP